MAQDLRALIGLLEDMFDSQNPYNAVTTTCNSRPRGYSAPFWPPLPLYAQSRKTCSANKHSYKIKVNKYSFKISK